MKKIVMIILALSLCASLFCIPTLAETATPYDESSIVETASEPTTADEDATEGDADTPITESIIDFITSNYTGSSLLALAITVITYLFYSIKANKRINASCTTLNNNAVTIAKSSSDSINDISGFKSALENLMGRFEKTEQEKAHLECVLENVTKYLNATKLATIEMSNEVAELIIFANLPNSAKDAMLKRHNAVLEDIKAVEEDKSDDRIKA